MKKYNVAVVGATGMVGRKFLQVLEERRLPVNEYFLFASAKSAGKKVSFMGKEYEIIELTPDSIKGKNIDIALFSAGAGTSKTFAPLFAEEGAVVIDNSSQWRMDPNVPLVVPEVNPQDIDKHKGIIANPNCSTIQAVVALKPLYDKYGIRRIVYSTYQAVSGAGLGGYEDLKNGNEGQYRIKLAHIYQNGQEEPEYCADADTGYCGNVVLDDGTIVTTSYGHFDSEDKVSLTELRTSICSKRINLKDTDALVAQMQQ